MPLTPQEVASKVFGPTRMRRGYDENEVDAFLDQVEVELTRLTTENDQLRRELELAREGRPVGEESAIHATAPPPLPQPAELVAPAAEAVLAPAAAASPAPAPDDAAVEQRVARMLVLAQQTADAAVREAQAEAERTRGAARAEAERVMAEAHGRASEEISNLERSKSVLEGEVEQLQTFEHEYRQRLRAYLEMQLRDLDIAMPGPAAVEIGSTNALDAGGESGLEDAGQEHPEHAEENGDGEPATASLSDPPGFGPVWSPGTGGPSGIDPLIKEELAPEGRMGASPFDTGGGGHRSGSFGSDL